MCQRLRSNGFAKEDTNNDRDSDNNPTIFKMIILNVYNLIMALVPKVPENDPRDEADIDLSRIPKESSYEFQGLGLGGSMIITPYVFKDERGEFIETFHRAQFRERLGLDFAQDCTSVSRLHCLRGIHGDFRTWKLIHCPKGSVLACIVDLNPGSPTYFQSRRATISDRNRWMLLVPPGFGNSFLVLEHDTIYSYKKTTYFRPGAEFTLRYDTRETGIEWPENIDFLLSKRDTEAPDSRESFEAAMRQRTDLENNPFLAGTSVLGTLIRSVSAARREGSEAF